ncbi:cysteine hydrolase [Tessaracoccus lapidicaptus]|uniref:Cysteine hydrolase n=1 Tax=Tessaracoccus lapidicaptus TaxID=1427523 RepID=A0A1C0ARC3_9ACTN|nr:MULTISPECIES: isochorismatase family cysteine hydrolase [Tessaracoccus]AQX16211.1 cysteine hydrolase [Tessaracoccus sp. T2.5-30]OCL36917.1 cysteine hydrolase [Tessaracoccus lapidicaptus]VEP40791.1 Isochorismatase family protein YecD [Tessaracoccus lapidicaptus]
MSPSPESFGHLPGELALVVVDVQNSYFELPGLTEQKDALLPKVLDLIHAAHDAGRPVILVRTQHERDRSTWTLNMLEDHQGFAFPGTAEAQFVDGVADVPHVEIVKTRDSAFHGTDLRGQLELLGVTRLLLCGVSTHSCIAQTATDAFAYNLYVAVAVDAVTSENADLARALLEFLRTEMRQPTLAQADCLALLSGR